MSAPADQRQQVFARIREALRVPAPHRHVHHSHAEEKLKPQIEVEGIPTPESFRAWLPAVGTKLEEQIELFAQNSAQLKTEFVRCANLAEAARHVAALAQEHGWTHLATHQNELTIPLVERLPQPVLLTDSAYDVWDLERCDAAVSGCDALVAQTGSVLVTSVSAGGRALSVLPPHHIVIARQSQVVADLATALRGAKERYDKNWPSFLSFITGPSRTGDIERILVLGAHGPKKLTVLLVP